MKGFSVALLVPILWGAAAPVPLVVGVVHDQFGSPIAGALVQANSASTTTDASGTFALTGSSADGNLTISCDYCATAHVPATAGEPVLAIVRRYDRISSGALTDRDVRALRYSGVASLFALQPYAVVSDSSAPFPGPNVSFFGISPTWGGLPVDNGIPSYDITANLSTFRFWPVDSPEQTATSAPADGFRYGDSSGAGAFFVDTRALPGYSGVAAAGSEQLLRAAMNASGLAASASFSSALGDVRDRFDAGWSAPAGAGTLGVTTIFSDSREDEDGQTLNAAWNAVGLTYSQKTRDTVQVQALFDNGGYDGGEGQYGPGTSAGWSDFEADASVQTPGVSHVFAAAGLRSSTGMYAESSLPLSVAGSIDQSHVVAGAAFSGSGYDAQAGLGEYSVAYSGGTAGNVPESTALVSPSFSFTGRLSSHWSAQIASSDYFRFPSLVETYAFSTPSQGVQIERIGSAVAQVSYGDLRRLQIGIVAAGDQLHAAGMNAAWQVAPDVSLRAWAMEFNNVPEQVAATTHTFWATYENPAGLRLDVVQGRDLLDGYANEHLDASVSTPVAPHVRLFVTTQKPELLRSYAAGLELGP